MLNWGFCDAFDNRNADFSRLYKLIISNKSKLLLNCILDILWDQLESVTRIIMNDYKKSRDDKARRKL